MKPLMTDGREPYLNQVLAEVKNALEKDKPGSVLSADAKSEGQKVGETVQNNTGNNTGSKAVGRLASLPTILRWVGATVLICAALAFILQSWSAWMWYQRYLSFLGFTLVIAGSGILSGLRLKDDKTARTFLGISAAIIPAHFTQLGALVRSQIPGSAEHIPDLFLLQAHDPLLLMLLIALAFSLLSPVIYLSFSAMARTEAKRLTGVYLLANALLLIPTRQPDLVALLAFAVVALVGAFDMRYFSREPKLKTFEGRAVRVMLFTPLVLLLVRNALLYPVSNILLSFFCLLVGVIMLVCIPRVSQDRDVSQLSEGLSILPLGYSWMLFANGVFLDPQHAFFYHPVVDTVMLPVLGLPIALLLVCMSFLVKTPGRNYRRAAAALAISVVVIQLFTNPGVIASLLCIVTSIGVGIAGYLMEEKVLLQTGGFGLVMGVFYQLRYAMMLYAFSPWLSLAIVGIATVFLASYVERKGSLVTKHIGEFQARVKAWE